MAGAAANHPINITKEQQEIDELIQSLLQFKPNKKPKETPSVPAEQNTPKNPVRRETRGRGKPNKIAKVSESPSLSPTVVSGDTFSASHFHELFLECLTRINKQNKTLIEKVNDLDQKLVEQSQKIESLEAKIENGPPSVSSAIINVPPPKPEISPSLIENVVNRVEKIEENLNSQVLVCRGPTVTTKISYFTEGSNPNLQRIKAEVCKEILGSKVTEIAVDSIGVSVFGKNKNLLKLKCSNGNVRDLLLQQAKITRPRGIFVAEFLSSEKLQIYNRLFNLKKQYPRWLKAVYTRRGSVFAVMGEGSEVRNFNSLQAVYDLELPTASPGPSVGGVSPPPPPPPPPPPSPSLPVDGASGGSAE